MSLEDTARSIVQDTVHRGSVVLSKDDVIEMARGYLEFKRIHRFMQEALDKNMINYVGISVADNVETAIKQPKHLENAT